MDTAASPRTTALTRFPVFKVTAVGGCIQQYQILALLLQFGQCPAQVPGTMAENFGRLLLSPTLPGAGTCLWVDIDNHNITSLFARQRSKV